MKKLSQMVFAVAMCGAGLVYAGPGDTKAQPAPPPTGAKMDMPKGPPQEIADMAKAMDGTWKCTGTDMGMDGSSMKFNASMTSKTDLDGWWQHDSLVGTSGEGKTAMKFKMESYTTFDAGMKKWHSVSVMNDGGQMVGQSDGMKDMKMDTTADTWGPMGQGMFKDHVDASDMKKGVHMWGEVSIDKGKTFKPVYDMMCKK